MRLKNPGGVGARFDGRKHKVIETSASRFLRTHLQDPDIFTYQHTDTKNWMVAVWMAKGVRMYELKNLGRSPALTPEVVRQLERMKPGHPEGREARKALRQHLNSEPKREIEELQADNAELQEAKRAIQMAVSKGKRGHWWFTDINKGQGGEKIMSGFGGLSNRR
jgi:hypothetical protein